MRKIKSLPALLDRVARDETFATALSQDPVGTLDDVTEVPDTWVYRLVIIALGLIVLATAIGAIVVAVAKDVETPAFLVSLGSAGLGALAGLLSPSPKNG